jgi:alkyl hydroperoxide reductase 1
VSFQIFANDTDIKFSTAIGWTAGERTARYAIVVDHGKVTYAELETEKGSIAKSGADAVIAKL